MVLDQFDYFLIRSQRRLWKQLFLDQTLSASSVSAWQCHILTFKHDVLWSAWTFALWTCQGILLLNSLLCTLGTVIIFALLTVVKRWVNILFTSVAYRIIISWVRSFKKVLHHVVLIAEKSVTAQLNCFLTFLNSHFVVIVCTCQTFDFHKLEDIGVKIPNLFLF